MDADIWTRILHNSMYTNMKRFYQTPVARIGGLAWERAFLVSATFSDITPGEDPGTGGSWEFGDDD